MLRIGFGKNKKKWFGSLAMLFGLSGINPAAAQELADDIQSRSSQAQVVPAIKTYASDSDDTFQFQTTDPDDVFQPTALHLQQPGPPSQIQIAPQTFDRLRRDSRPSLPVAVEVFGRPASGRKLLSRNRRILSGRPSATVILGSESRIRQSSDAGDLLRRSPSSLGVAGQRRSPIITDTRVRGGRIGSLLASGSYWFPARQDLDTLMSKIDSRILEDMIVIKGPYSARYGPGHSFVDFQLQHSPRFTGGPGSGASSSFDYKSNGEQFYGRQTFWGGDENYGFRVGYGHKGGVDYETGDGVDIPASYKSRDIDVAFGVDLDEDTSIEFNYLRLDQTDTEIATQIFDFDYLVTDGFEVTYQKWNNRCSNCDDLHGSDVVTIEGWYNQTRFEGNAQGSGKRRLMPRLSLPTGLGLTAGFTQAYNQSMGMSLDRTWYGDAGGSFTAGADVRHLKQGLNEFDASTRFSPTTLQNFPIPDAFQVNPGLFVESELPVGEWTIKSGARVDFYESDAETSAVLVAGDQFLPNQLGGGDFNRADFLFSGFVTAEYQINDAWKFTGGMGNSMRSPTMTELYSRGPFVTVMPQFAGTALFGNPGLEKEKRYQIDIGLHIDEGNFRAGATAYHAWVHNYITLDNVANIRDTTTGEILLPNYQFTNTDLATIAGFELYLEHDVNEWFTTFANMTYTEGRDHSRFETQSPIAINSFGPGFRSGFTHDDEPLFGIAPLQSQLGVRLQDPNERFGVEFMANITDSQDRIALSLSEQRTSGYTTFDIRAFARPTEKVMIVAGVENFTDKNYRTHFDPRHLAQVFQPGINFFFGSEINY